MYIAFFPTLITYTIVHVYSYCLNTSMRLFVIGHYRKGKSTVMAALRGTKESSHFDDRAKRLLDPSDHLTPEGTSVCA